MVIGHSVMCKARRPRINRSRNIDLDRTLHDDGLMKLKMVESGSGLSASQRTRRRQIVFRDDGPPVRAGNMAFDKMFVCRAATMPFGYAAFHLTDVRLARSQPHHRSQPADYQCERCRGNPQSEEGLFSPVCVHGWVIPYYDPDDRFYKVSRFYKRTLRHSAAACQFFLSGSRQTLGFRFFKRGDDLALPFSGVAIPYLSINNLTDKRYFETQN
jgi:hypothetical protein